MDRDNSSQVHRGDRWARIETVETSSLRRTERRDGRAKRKRRRERIRLTLLQPPRGELVEISRRPYDQHDGAPTRAKIGHRRGKRLRVCVGVVDLTFARVAYARQRYTKPHRTLVHLLGLLWGFLGTNKTYPALTSHGTRCLACVRRL